MRFESASGPASIPAGWFDVSPGFFPALGVPVVRRYSGGSDIAAACGTLAATRRGGAPLSPLPDPLPSP